MAILKEAQLFGLVPVPFLQRELPKGEYRIPGTLGSATINVRVGEDGFTAGYKSEGDESWTVIEGEQINSEGHPLRVRGFSFDSGYYNPFK